MAVLSTALPLECNIQLFLTDSAKKDWTSDLGKVLPQYLVFSMSVGSQRAVQVAGAGTKAHRSKTSWEAFEVGSRENLIQGAAADLKKCPVSLPAGDRRALRWQLKMVHTR